MPIKSDFHLHTSHSSDSDASMESMIEQGISLGLSHMCFTEHMDFDFPYQPGVPESLFIVNTDSYLYDFIRYKQKYQGQIELFFGIELGMQAALAKKQAQYIKEYEFDFVIGSSHLCNGLDPYYPTFYEGRSEEDAYREYFLSIIENIKAFQNFDVYGHLDYVVRYGPDKDRNYSYLQYKDLLDRILELLIENEKGLEVNTGGFRAGLTQLHPLTAVIKRYHELGGERITIGSDAHSPKHIASNFDHACSVLKECGFRYYTIYQGRMPEYIKL